MMLEVGGRFCCRGFIILRRLFIQLYILLFCLLPIQINLSLSYFYLSILHYSLIALMEFFEKTKFRFIHELETK